MEKISLPHQCKKPEFYSGFQGYQTIVYSKDLKDIPRYAWE